MFEGISRYRGPYTGGALAIFVFMDSRLLDAQLLTLFRDGLDDEFIEFGKSVSLDNPVSLEFRGRASQCLDMLGNALVVYSGAGNDDMPEYWAAVQRMREQEISSGRWMGLPDDEMELGTIIARRTYDDLGETQADRTDPEMVYQVVGLYCYAAVSCNDGLGGMSFMRLFVRAWFEYYSGILSIAEADMTSDSQCVS